MEQFEPHTWYTETRQLDRKFYFHMGPTNSGKTFSAINSLKKAKKGIYWAPLRLLAWEVAEKLNSEGIRCSLKTGQEKSVSEYDTHVACTIEMAKHTEEYDVAIIDEIQMIADKQRGWAWTNAVLGLQAKEIHLCGDQRSLRLISKLINITGDTLQRREYKRMSTLRADPTPIRSFQDLKPGDCIVGFSKKILFQMKSTINEKLDNEYIKAMKKIQKGKKNTKKHNRRVSKLRNEYLEENPLANRWALIYGSLPPETKKLQAMAFNDRSDGLDFLVATNAIGMGLNLNISRVIFTSIEKRVHGKIRPLEKTEILQIAGRAGRYTTDGYVSAFTTDTLNQIRQVIGEDKKQADKGKKDKKKSAKKDKRKEKKIELNIDEFQEQSHESEEEYEDHFVTISDITESEKEESEKHFEEEKGEEFLSDTNYNKHQSLIKAAGFFPMFDQLETFGYKVICETGTPLPFSHILKLFISTTHLSSLYFMADLTTVMEICKRLDKFDKSTLTKSQNKVEFLLDTYAYNKGVRWSIYNFAQSPIKIDSYNSNIRLAILEQLFSEFLYFKQVKLPGGNLWDYSILGKQEYSLDDLSELENLHNILEVYLWLGNKYEQEFVEMNEGTWYRGTGVMVV